MIHRGATFSNVYSARFLWRRCGGGLRDWVRGDQLEGQGGQERCARIKSLDLRPADRRRKGRGGTCRDGKISDLGCYCRGSIAIEPGEKHNRKGRCWIEGEFSLLKCELHVGRKVEM